jgi:hypothetical protein
MEDISRTADAPVRKIGSTVFFESQLFAGELGFRVIGEFKND